MVKCFVRSGRKRFQEICNELALGNYENFLAERSTAPSGRGLFEETCGVKSLFVELCQYAVRNIKLGSTFVLKFLLMM